MTLVASYRVSLALVGEELEPRWSQCIELYDDGSIGVGSSCTGTVIDARGFVALPPLCNAHLHLLDGVAPEYGEGLSLEDLVAQPSGVKYRLIASTPRSVVWSRTLSLLDRLAGDGVRLAGVYGEMGFWGSLLVSQALVEAGFTGRVLAQPLVKRLSDYIWLGGVFSGLGLDTVFDVDSSGRRVIAGLAARHGWIVHVHVSETRWLYENEDYAFAVELGAKGFVHGIFLDVDEARSLLEQGMVWILCPRSNAMLAGYEPPLDRAFRLWREGFTGIALGTDNAGWVPPRVAEEAAFAYTLYAWRTGAPEEYARMLVHGVTLGCHRALGLSPRVLDTGSRPGFFVLAGIPDIDYSGSPLATIAKRLSGAVKVKTIEAGKG